MNNQLNWYKTFFDGLAVELWHNAVPKAYTQKEVDFITSVTRITHGAAILDVPCGSGRVAIPLARQGFNVTGIDISAENIELLNAVKAELPLQAVCADILEYDLRHTYDAAICMGNSFNYFPFHTMVAFATKICSSLRPGGRFVVNSGVVAESILPDFKSRNWYRMGDITFLVENNYDAFESLLKTDMQFIKGNAVEQKTSYHYVFSVAEIRRIFMQAGFSSVEVYSDVEKNSFSLGSAQAYFVAQK